MRTHVTATLTVAVLSAVILCGQTPAPSDQYRVLNFTKAEGALQMQQIATVVRSIAGIRRLSVDVTQRAMSVYGTSGQIALAGWLLERLDRLGDRPAEALEYRMPDSGDDVVRVFYLPYAKTVQELQEAATVVRTTAEIRRLFAYDASRAVAARGTAEQIAIAAWLLDELGKPAVESSTAPEYRVTGSNDDVVRVLHLTHTKTVRDFQELVTLVRSITGIRKVFTYSSPRAVALRGPSDRADLAEWLSNELDKAGPHGAASNEYQISDPRDEGVVRVFYLPQVTTVEEFQRTVTFVRTTADIRLAFTYSVPRALAVRGSPAQIARVEELIADRIKPN